MYSVESTSEFYSNIDKCNTEDNIASKLVVAVMTVCGSFGSNINLPKLYEYYKEVGCEDELSYVPNSKKSNESKGRAFYNCLGVKFDYVDVNNVKSTISAKVFPNGSIQLPGCRTIETVYGAPLVLYEFIKKFSKECSDATGVKIISNQNNFKLTNVRIVMINSNFTFEKGIIQEKLKDIINKYRFNGNIDNNNNVWRIASFQPEKYSGLNARYMTNSCRIKNADMFEKMEKIPIKLDGQISIFIFRSGKATITGAKKTEDLLEAYDVVTKLVRENSQIVFHSTKC